MRLLVLIRHAKAERGAADDRARRLTGQGRADAAALGRWLADAGLDADLVLVSPAKRAEETWRLAAEAGARGRAVGCDALYDANLDTILDLVAGCGDGVAALGVVGHNPTLQEAADALLAERDGAALGGSFPPGTAVALRFDVEHWAEIRPGEGALHRFATPRLLGAGGG
ncbi:MAG TPA: histidine phosphatase family protein [Hyphomicrobiales bacterium]|nr:histidine phosphatase family protein [Hyphomicrobiales bacterium]